LKVRVSGKIDFRFLMASAIFSYLGRLDVKCKRKVDGKEKARDEIDVTA